MIRQGGRRGGKKAYAEFVREDVERIEVRAMTLYALTDPGLPWPVTGSEIRAPYIERAGRELWEEGALHLDPSAPYYEGTDT